MVPSVTNRMNITEIAGKFLYSGGTNGLGRIFVLVILINLLIKSRSSPDDKFVQPLPYRVQFETYCGTDHRATL